MTKYPSQLQDKFNLRLPDGMKDAIAERAKKNGRSINSEIVQILEDALNGKSQNEEIYSLSRDTMDKLISVMEAIQQLSPDSFDTKELKDLNKE
ncbi:Arc family DNA-binding protein [Proteus mirabilis]|uniref:Arc family DNA-binding protein n=1 Tax=Proteus mirabilis TaxID=584 RepID=UPI001330E28D|nr:Arc family DNA-binding protein [Proteus mirabilis]